MGKPQVADKHQPAARMVAPATLVANEEENAEAAEISNDLQRKREHSNARANKVSTFLKENFYRTDKTWPFLFWPVAKRQLSVTMFFPKKNLAVDQFARPTDYDRKSVEFKKSEFKKHGIKYLPMFPETKMMALADFI